VSDTVAVSSIVEGVSDTVAVSSIVEGVSDTVAAVVELAVPPPDLSAVETGVVVAVVELAVPPPPPHAVKRKSAVERAKTFFIFDTRDILFTLV